MYKLHFAKTALKATKKAMLASIRPDGGDSESFVREDTILWSGGLDGVRQILRGWSEWGDTLAGADEGCERCQRLGDDVCARDVEAGSILEHRNGQPVS